MGVPPPRYSATQLTTRQTDETGASDRLPHYLGGAQRWIPPVPRLRAGPRDTRPMAAKTNRKLISDAVSSPGDNPPRYTH